MKTVVVTGANGFIGKNLCATLQQQGEYQLLKVTRKTTTEVLYGYLKECDFIFHLAGVNRPQDEKEFFEVNADFTAQLVQILKENNRKVPIVYTSSIQVDRDNPYGQSKKLGEQALLEYAKTGAPVYIYRLTNIYGKWSRPDYNSVVATFCHNIARDLPIKIDNSDAEINLCYIDDVVEEFLRALEGNPTVQGDHCIVPVSHPITVGALADTIRSFKESRNDLFIADMSNPLVKNLYSTYLSFLPEDAFSYPLKMNVDNRGSFTEIIRTPERGQVSVNITKPGITKGNHWHHSKNEKFLVVSGTGVIRFRKVGADEVLEYHVSGDKMETVDIPPGYTHNIENTGDTDLVTIMWANEPYNPEKPDTYFLEV
ncbi:NAD dependent epimerase/dehydratase family protein [Pelotomaculum schinkii]|uniref:NAD dependent epimerase/dehydratase family protein n=1 Tax=Pelotomaculum schinkii TaxID=78350 RepID=A0A4Y7RHI5_9FIRM|nr:NAD-dependent epimerase/dehydratase family protein [Pelotomaculum schinkii]TEB08220.1 NAD dependent epimerase/dehydratase family protein [Pelotomaculum schinkii]